MVSSFYQDRLEHTDRSQDDRYESWTLKQLKELESTQKKKFVKEIQD